MLVFKATFQKWGNDIIKLWVAMFVDIASEVQFWVGLCLGIFEKFLSVLPAPIAKAFGWVQEKAEGFFSWGVDAIKEAVGKAKEHFDSLKTTMSSVFDIRKEIADALAMLKELGSGMIVGPMTISAQAKTEKPESLEEEMLKEQRALIDSLYQHKMKRWEDEVKIRVGTFKKERDAGMAAAMETEAYMSQADRRWAEARIELARYAYEEQLAKGKGTAAELAAAQIEYDRTVAEAELAWQDAVWEDYKNKHQEQMMLIRGLEAAWDTMVDTALDKEMTGKQRREEMWQSMKRSFLQTTSDMMKAWLGNHIRSLLLAEATEKGINVRRKFQEAKIGAVKAYQAFAGIPIIGPILGAVAAAAAFAFLMAFHKGGYVGPEERIIKVQTEEFIMQRSAVRGIGRPAMEYINATGRLPATSSAASPTLNFNINATGGGEFDSNGLKAFIEDKVVPQLEDFINRRGFRTSEIGVVLR
jgi:hypothetical protein